MENKIRAADTAMTDKSKAPASEACARCGKGPDDWRHIGEEPLSGDAVESDYHRFEETMQSPADNATTEPTKGEGNG